MSRKNEERYWKRFVLPDEKVLHAFGISRWYLFFFWVLPSAAVGWIAGFVLLRQGSVLGLLMFLIPLAMLLPAAVMAFFTHYVITDKRVMSRTGFLYKHFITINLRSVTDMAVKETFLERIFTKTGVILINTAGSDAVEMILYHVRRPFDLRKDIYKHYSEMIRQEGRGQNSQQGTA